jgi:hypothetical protein
MRLALLTRPSGSHWFRATDAAGKCGVPERCGADPKEWDTLASVPFVDVTRSRPGILRALYIPVLSSKANLWASYVLLQRRPQRPLGFLSSIF